MAVWFAYAALAAYQANAGLKQAQDIQSAARLQRQLNQLNAQWAELDAFNAENDGLAEAAAYLVKVDQTASEQKIAYQQQNVDTSFGTAADMQAETRSIGLMNQIKMENEARARARGFEREASRLRMQGDRGIAEADMAANAATISGYGQAAGSAIKSYDTYYGPARKRDPMLG